MQLLVLACLIVATIQSEVISKYTDWDSVYPRDIENDEVLGHTGGRITNGEMATPKQFPYQVGLLIRLDSGRSWCGGTIISEQWVLTAAHCVDGARSADLYLGAINRTNPSEDGQKIIKVEKDGFIVHEKWNPSRILNDIALIHLPNALEFNDYIQAAKLPSGQQMQLFVGERAIASGWGRTSDSETKPSPILQWVEVPIMDNRMCKGYYMGNVVDTNICIDTSGRKSTCNGDSGGPLVLADGTNTLIGATSFGIRLGCEVQFPAVFTRITSYLDWIDKKMKVE